MNEWLTYRPQDFLMFSPRVYWRLFELHNAAWWPLQFLTLTLGLGILLVMLRPRPWRIRFGLAGLAATWGFVGWAFVWQRYAPINWAMGYVAPLFALQALLLISLGMAKGGLVLPTHWNAPRLVGLALLAYALLVHPFMGPLAGRDWRGIELFGFAPDPLAIATLGLVSAAYPARRAWVLMIIPALWCLISWGTLYTLEADEAWLPLLAVSLALAARLWPMIPYRR